MMLLKQCYLLLWQLHFCFSVFEQACFGDVICTMMSPKRHYLLPISILCTTMLSKQGYICRNNAEATILCCSVAEAVLFLL